MTAPQRVLNPKKVRKKSRPRPKSYGNLLSTYWASCASDINLTLFHETTHNDKVGLFNNDTLTASLANQRVLKTDPLNSQAAFKGLSQPHFCVLLRSFLVSLRCFLALAGSHSGWLFLDRTGSYRLSLWTAPAGAPTDCPVFTGSRRFRGSRRFSVSR